VSFKHRAVQPQNYIRGPGLFQVENKLLRSLCRANSVTDKSRAINSWNDQNMEGFFKKSEYFKKSGYKKIRIL